ncbi:MAG TPA: universal stress protein [Gemmatimonadaceae bacterium]|nr:universal stress protein [Gemmatimonadaceae bacterium]
MSTTAPSATPTATPRATRTLPLAGGVLLASRGGAASEGAARLAAVFAARRHVSMEVLGVMEPIPSDIRDYAPDVDRVLRDYRLQLSETLEAFLVRASIPTATPVAIEEGRPADCIAHRAQARGAALIAIGIGRHAALDRLLGAETAIGISRRTSVPVLAATSDATAPARSIVIATDFSPASQRAAELAMALAADDAIVHLVHVWPWMNEVERAADAATRRRVYEAGTRRMFDELIKSLPTHPAGCFVTHLRHGETETAIIDLARDERADLIALGSHGRGFIDRLALGSVAESVLRTGACSILIAPPTPAEKES